tara:strand:+ start:533 stop:952 length:420 start_codon:yes stop_codon:yes gene_type:complete
MKKNRYTISKDSEIDVNILPLIDVLFVVLLFFMLSTLFLTKRYSFNVSRPSVENSSTELQSKTATTITIDKERDIFIGSKNVDLNSLQSELQLQNKQKKLSQIYIDADRSIDYGYIMEVLGIVSTLDIQSISLAFDRDK